MNEHSLDNDVPGLGSLPRDPEERLFSMGYRPLGASTAKDFLDRHIGDIKFTRTFYAPDDTINNIAAVQKVCGLYLEKSETIQSVVDFGSGSGVLAFSCLESVASGTSQCLLIDRDNGSSAGAVAVSRENARRLGLESRCSFCNKDVSELTAGDFAGLRAGGVFIVNLPHLPVPGGSTLPISIKGAGPTGSLLWEKVFGCARFLNPRRIVLSLTSMTDWEQLFSLMNVCGYRIEHATACVMADGYYTEKCYDFFKELPWSYHYVLEDKDENVALRDYFYGRYSWIHVPFLFILFGLVIVRCSTNEDEAKGILFQKRLIECLELFSSHGPSESLAQMRGVNASFLTRHLEEKLRVRYRSMAAD